MRHKIQKHIILFVNVQKIKLGSLFKEPNFIMILSTSHG